MANRRAAGFDDLSGALIGLLISLGLVFIVGWLVAGVVSSTGVRDDFAWAIGLTSAAVAGAVHLGGDNTSFRESRALKGFADLVVIVAVLAFVVGLFISENDGADHPCSGTSGDEGALCMDGYNDWRMTEAEYGG